MKLRFIVGLLFISFHSFSQSELKTFEFSLPKEIEYYDNQFSGLYVYNGYLYLLSESRLQDKAEAKLYKIPLADLEKQMKTSADTLTYTKIPILGLSALREAMDEEGNKYEGAEALIIDSSDVYISIETQTPNKYCYLLKGKLYNERVEMGNMMLPMRKPRLEGDEPVYNAGFETLALKGNEINAFYEYNYFKKGNYVYRYSPSMNFNDIDSIKIKPLPFRITDITSAKKNKFVAINYFYKGAGADEIYRVAANNPNFSLTQQNGAFESYTRLIALKIGKKKVNWKPFGLLPQKYWAYNWEGIAKYKKGYFLINDKYTPAKPYKTTLLFVHK